MLDVSSRPDKAKAAVHHGTSDIPVGWLGMVQAQGKVAQGVWFLWCAGVQAGCVWNRSYSRRPEVHCNSLAGQLEHLD